MLPFTHITVLEDSKAIFKIHMAIFVKNVCFVVFLVDVPVCSTTLTYASREQGGHSLGFPFCFGCYYVYFADAMSGIGNAQWRHAIIRLLIPYPAFPASICMFYCSLLDWSSPVTSWLPLPIVALSAGSSQNSLWPQIMTASGRNS